MSGGKAESTATFYAALKTAPELTNDPQLQKVGDIFESFVKNTLAPTQLRPIIKSGENPIVNAAEIAHTDDDAYCEKIANSMRLQARFKTSSRKLKGVKTGEYNFWSVVSLIVDAMGASSVNEGIFDVVKGKLKKIGLKILNSIKLFLSKKVSNVFKFLGAEPEIKVTTKVNF